MKPMGYEVPQYAPVQKPPQEDMDYGVIGNALSGLGNLIDIPGSMVRDTISLSNPFDQLMTPFSSDNRTSGAEISRYWMGGDEDSGGNQMAGLMIDILTDPTVLLTGGTSAAARAGMRGGSAALKGLSKVGQAARGAYDTAKSGSLSARAAKSAQRSYDEADRLSRVSGNLRAQLQGKDMPAGLGPMPQRDPRLAYGPEYSWNPEFVGPPSGRVPREDLIANRPPEVATAATLVQAYDDFGRAARNQGAMRQARAQSMARNPLIRANESAQSLGSGAMAGGRQLGQSMYGGSRAGLGAARDSAMDLGRRAMAGDRNAMLQAYGIGSNALQTATGQRMSEEPTLEDLIAQALMEDPALSEELLMMLGAGE